MRAFSPKFSLCPLNNGQDNILTIIFGIFAIFIAAIEEITYKYKLIVKENKSGITHAENGEYCNGLGLM